MDNPEIYENQTLDLDYQTTTESKGCSTTTHIVDSDQKNVISINCASVIKRDTRRDNRWTVYWAWWASTDVSAKAGAEMTQK